MNDSSADRNPVEVLAEEFLERQRRGDKPTLREYCELHPDLADEIRLVFPALCMVEDLKPETGQVTGEFRRPPVAPLERIGDYRLIREVGRGGMGIVYEAEQESLGRHVALKVLPPSALLDQRQLARFQREAKAAARLHHTNIVPVYGVGSHENTHYYVMQFIQGLGLDEVLEELRRIRLGKEEAEHVSVRALRTADVSQVAQGLLTGALGTAGQSAYRSGAAAEEGNGHAARGRSSATVTEIGDSSSGDLPRHSADSSIHLPGQSAESSLSETGRQYWHSVARIGIQVADALAYANNQGTLHRDIKPSNLLLDTQGTVWVTDFGLAKAVVEQDNLTHTGDIVGTLRYMAPERFHGQGDARSDIYGLGLTLYEMLTLRPAFDERGREKLVRQVMHDEPPRPRKLNQAIPRDLETIVQKAIAREPDRRYASATALAEDLNRFLEDKPIQARRVTARERLVRWCRRNPALAASLGLAAAALVAVAVISVIFAQAQAENSAILAKTNQELDATNQGLLSSNLELAEARLKTTAALKDSQRQTELNRRQLARLTVEQATQRMDNHDQFNALLLATRALELDAGDSQREAIHRQRIAGILQQCPRPMRVWNSGRVSHAEFSPDGKQVLIVSTQERSREDDEWMATANARVWDVATATPVTPPLAHGDFVYFAKFSPDGRRVCTVARTGRVKAEDEDETAPGAEVLVWDVATHKPVGPPIKTPGWLRRWTDGVNWHPSGEALVTATEAAGDGDTTGEAVPPRHEAIVWEVTTGNRRFGVELDAPRKPEGTPQGVSALYDAAGRRLLIVGASVQLVDAMAGKVQKILEQNQGGISRGAVFSPDGRLVLAYGLRARLYDAQTGARIGPELTHAMAITDAAFSPDGKLVVTTSHDHTACIWSVATGERVVPPLVHDGQVVQVSFSADGRRIVTSTYGGSAWIWDVATGNQVETRLPHAGLVYGAEFSPDARHVLTHGSDGAVKVWDLAATETSGQPLTDNGDFAQFSPDGRRLATISFYGHLQLFNAATGKREAVLSKWGKERAEALAFSPDGKLLAATNPVGEYIRIWNSETDAVGWLRTPGRAIFIMFSPDGRRLIANCALQSDTSKLPGCELLVWDLDNVDKPRHAPALRIANRAYTDRHLKMLALSRDARYAALNRESDLAIYDLTTGELLQSLKHVTTIRDLAFSPDSDALAVAGNNFKVKVWDVKTGAVRWQQDHGGWVSSVEYSHDGQRVLTASYDGTARIWHAKTGEPLVTMTHRGIVSGAHFSDDGRLVVSASWDKTARVWEAATGHPVTPPLQHAGLVTRRCGFNADGTQLYTASYDEMSRFLHVHLWDLPKQARPLGDLAALARGLAARDLSKDGLLVHHLPSAETWSDLRRRWPDDFRATQAQIVAWHVREARLSDAARAWRVAALHWQRLAEIEPANAVYYDRWIEDLAQSGQIPAALASVSKALQRDPDQRPRSALEPNVSMDLAALHLANDDQAAYREVCAKLYEKFNSSKVPSEINNVCWPMCFAADAHPDLRGLADKAATLLTKDPKNWALLNTAGCFLYRAGRDDDALKWLDAAMKADKTGEGSPFDWVFLAMVHERQGRAEEARKWLEKTKAFFAEAVQGRAKAPPERLWRLKLGFLIREAEAALGVAPKVESSPKPKGRLTCRRLTCRRCHSALAEHRAVPQRSPETVAGQSEDYGGAEEAIVAVPERLPCPPCRCG